MTREELREKVAMAIAEAYYRDLSDGEYGVADLGEAKEWFPEADAAIALVLEEAAKVADGIKATIYDDDLIEVGRLQACKEIAAAIRALKEKP